MKSLVRALLSMALLGATLSAQDGTVPTKQTETLPIESTKFEARLSEKISDLGIAVLDKWLETADPNAILSYLQKNFPDSLEVLARHGDSSARRIFLARIVASLAAIPNVSDVDVLCGAVEWITLFHADKGVGKPQFDRVTRDMILLFTDRAANGLTLSTAGYYRAGRFLDRGFADPLRDDSDQVRHFTWAMRLFATSRDLEQTTALLRLKEIRDAMLRGEPLNAADLELNESARRVAEAIYSSESVPASGYAALMRSELER